jgi:hypothetical protein
MAVEKSSIKNSMSGCLFAIYFRKCDVPNQQPEASANYRQRNFQPPLFSGVQGEWLVKNLGYTQQIKHFCKVIIKSTHLT